MEQSIFAVMEQTQIIDRILLWTALLFPLFAAGLAFTLRHEDIVTKNRHRWVLACLTPAGVLILWEIYNGVVNRYGLESIKALVINIIIFIVAALLATALRVILRALLTTPPPPPVKTQPIPVQKFTTTRMRSLSLNEASPEASESSSGSTSDKVSNGL